MSTSTYTHFVERLEATPQATIHLGLEVMREAVVEQNLNRPAPTIVIVAGTNGKGTVAAALSQLCTRRGWKTALLTSPHLVDVRERIRIDGIPIDRETLYAIGDPILRRYGAESGRLPRPLTYFELTVLLGLKAAQQVHADVLIMEVGLGGQFDATNVLDADLSIFASISLDHTDLLGSTVEAIAYEKSRVARPDRPAILHPELNGADVLVPLLDQMGAQRIEASGGHDARSKNMALAARAFSVLEKRAGQRSSKVFVRDALEDFQWPGRLTWTTTPTGTRILLDGAHNPASAEELARELLAHPPTRPLPAVISLSGGRDVAGIVAPIARFVRTWHVCMPPFERSMPAIEVAEQLLRYESASAQDSARHVVIHTDVQQALRAAERESREHHHPGMLAFGSLYLIAEIYKLWWPEDDEALSFSRSSAASVSSEVIAPTPPIASESYPQHASADTDWSPLQSAPEPLESGGLQGDWFPEDAMCEPAQRRVAFPRATATAAAFSAIILMTMASLAVPEGVPIYGRISVGTIVGNALPALVLIWIFRLPWNLRPPTARLIAYAVFLGVVFSMAGTFLTALLHEVYTILLSGTSAEQWWRSLMEAREESYGDLLNPKGVPALISAILAVAVAPGIFEEFLFRGAIYRAMQRVVVWRRILFIGALFSFIHFDVVGFVPLLLLGILLTWLRALSGSWVYSAIVHFAFNLTALGLALLGERADSWTDNSVHNAEDIGLMPLVLIATLFGGLAAYFFRSFGKKLLNSQKSLLNDATF